MTSAALARLHARCFTKPRPWTADEFDKILGLPHVFLLKQAGGFLVGRCAAGEAELLTLAVPPEARRQGTGRMLVEAFLHRVALMGGQQSFLEVAADNTAARALYADMGFEEVGTRKGYFDGTDGLVLRHRFAAD